MASAVDDPCLMVDAPMLWMCCETWQLEEDMAVACRLAVQHRDLGTPVEDSAEDTSRTDMLGNSHLQGRNADTCSAVSSSQYR